MRAPKNRRATARRITQLEDEQNPPPSVRQRRLGFLGKVALALGSLVLTLSALEVAVRLTTSFLDQERGMTFDRELGWRPLPNVRKIGQVWGVVRPARSNSKGWRDAERSYSRPEGKRRAVALGDSFTFGVGVDDGERYTDLLNARCRGWEVVNLGVAGYGIDQELRLLEVEAFRYEPELVLLTVFLGNDPEDIRHDLLYSQPKPYYTFDGDLLELIPPKETIVHRLRNLSYLAEFVYRRLVDANRQSNLAPEWVDADPVPLFERIVHRIAEVTSKHGARLLVVLVYNPEQAAGGLSARDEKLRLFFSEAGIETLDTYELFHNKGGLYRKGGDVHWNARGHELVAQMLCTRALERSPPPTAK